MIYHDCAIKHGSRGDSIRWKYGYLWGGSLAENLVQSACRDIMTTGWLNCEDKGIPICFQLYDELVTCVPLPKAKKMSSMMYDIMVTPPVWAEGCPLDAEGTISSYYVK